MDDLRKYVSDSVLEKYELHSYGHALEILNEAFPNEWNEIQDCLTNLIITPNDILEAGGNETSIPKKI